MTTYITTPIYYPNALPHIGTAYTTLAADVYARFARLCGREAVMLTGTDEHGKKIYNAAHRQNMTPQAFTDQLSQQFKESFQRLNIEFSRFIRTTDEDHIELVQTILQRIYDRGDIYKGTYEGYYCVECESYYTEEELIDGKCPIHGIEVEWLVEDCYYFRLSKYQDWLLEYYESHPHFILPLERRNEVVSFVENGLQDLCISRSTFDWGVAFPFAKEHVAYVWFDALHNYLTGAGYLTDSEKFERLWPEVTHLIGKDILRFHAVIWPAILKAAEIDPPKRVVAHGFLTVNGKKFSKSLGNVIRPDFLVDKYGLDPVRYYLFREFPFSSDGDFSEPNLIQRNNSELAQGLGNLVQRITVMITRYRDGVVPGSSIMLDEENALAESCKTLVDKARSSIEQFNFKKALDLTWGLIHQLNIYLNNRQPWKLAKKDEDEMLDMVLATLVEGVRFLLPLIAPFVPDAAFEIARRLGLSEMPLFDSLVWGETLTGNTIDQGKPLFAMIESPQEVDVS